MHTTEEYLNQLDSDRLDLVHNIIEQGIAASENETFTTLVPKVRAIQGGGTGGGGSTTEQYGIIFEEVTDDGIPTKITFNLGLFSQVPTFSVNTISQVSHLRFKGEKIKTIQGGNLSSQVISGLKLLIIPASVRKLVLDLYAFQQPIMYMLFEGEVPPTVSVNGEATCDITIVHPDNIIPEEWGELVSAISISGSAMYYSDFVNDVCEGEDPWNSVIYY